MSKILLVTGASRGIGAATARLAALRGWAVAVNYRAREDEARRVVEGIIAAGGTAIAVQADVAREDDVLRMFDTIDRALGPLDGLVNNAGVLERQGRLVDMEPAR